MRVSAGKEQEIDYPSVEYEGEDSGHGHGEDRYHQPLSEFQKVAPERGLAHGRSLGTERTVPLVVVILVDEARELVHGVAQFCNCASQALGNAYQLSRAEDDEAQQQDN